MTEFNNQDVESNENEWQTLVEHGEPMDFDLQTVDFTTAPIFEKSAVISAKVANGGEIIETFLADGTKETENTAEAGDMIVTNPGGERYIIKPDTFAKKYEQTDENGTYKAKGMVRALPNPTGKEIKIVAPWGEEQVGSSESLVVVGYDPNNPNEIGDDRYIIGKQEFDDTYKPKVESNI